MEYIVNYIVAGLLAVVALVALVQTAIARRNDRWSRPELKERRGPDDKMAQDFANFCDQERESAVRDRQNDNDVPR